MSKGYHRVAAHRHAGWTMSSAGRVEAYRLTEPMLTDMLSWLMCGNPLFIRPWRRRLAKAFALLIVVLLLVTGGAFWRLSRGPVSLELLRPRIESALNELASPLSVELGTSSLSWSGWPRPVDLRVRDARVKNPAGDEVPPPGEASRQSFPWTSRWPMRSPISRLAGATARGAASSLPGSISRS